MRSDSGAIELIATLRRCQAAGDVDALYFCAAWLHGCGDRAANSALSSLFGDVDLGAESFDAALRELARQRFDELVQWCIDTARLLNGGVPADPSVWLPGLTYALRRDDFQLNAGIHRVALADMALLTCSDAVLSRNAAHIRAYQTVRTALLGRAAALN
ncbi:hypothetical protein [Gordonia rubripertincta]|uniref:Uncharacterized protein n=1 Tax=Gordonia rubripertincta TaxID=36822 RepID=A0ABT4MUX9_GORRU|nr:hypothetical protein [Gordonia rubripertincta]MCZ4550818.1 hypothetical protein [Gordonia rubripertincta]